MGTICDVSEILLELGLSGSNTETERAIASTALTRAEGAVKRFLKYDPVQRTRTEYYPQNDFSTSIISGAWETEGNQAIYKKYTYGDTDELQIQHIPLRSVTNLYVDYDGRNGTKAGSFPASSEKTEGSDFWPNYDSEGICRDGIIRSHGAWPITPGSVKLVYIAGYTNDELHGHGGVVDASPIINSVISETIRRAKKAFLGIKQTTGWTPGAVSGEKMGDYAVSYSGDSSSALYGGQWSLTPETMNELDGYVNWGVSL